MNTEIRSLLVKTTSFDDLASLVKRVKEDVTFFGYRYVYLPGESNSLPIDALAIRAIELASRGTNLNQNPNEKRAVSELIPLINEIYDQNKAKWKNPITFTLCFARDVWKNTISEMYWGYNTRFYWNKMFSKNTCTLTVNNPNPTPMPESLVDLCIKEEINAALGSASSFKDLLPLVKNAKAEVSYLGCRYIKFDDYEGTLPVNALAGRVIELARVDPNYSSDNDFQSIVPLIDTLYQQNDTRYKERNLLTRVSCSFRDIFQKDDMRVQWNKLANPTQDTSKLNEN